MLQAMSLNVWVSTLLILGFAGVAHSADFPIETGEKFELAQGLTPSTINHFAGFQASSIQSPNEIRLIERTVRSAKNPHSQCFNRATVWAYEASEQVRIETGKPLDMVKVFRFFSTRYMSHNQFDWWFHVAPGFVVGPSRPDQAPSLDQVMMLDKRAYGGAVLFRDWDRYFFNMTGNQTVSAQCRVVKSYYEFTQLRDSPKEDCFDLIAPMYYHTPDDFALVERWGQKPPAHEWDRDVVAGAYSQAGLGRFRSFR